MSERPENIGIKAIELYFPSQYKIDPKDIGRLEVGTETILDKSKSVKSVLMQLFKESGNTNVEGVDTVNACYGGTNALFNAINWVESSAWDGRLAIVVAGDIALYKKGAARPTGGAGCPGHRGSYITHAYDFYKPDLTSEYPIVDGQFSIKCYTQAVDACYEAYNTREAQLKSKANGAANGNGLVSKSYARMLYNDYKQNPENPIFAEVPAEIKDMDLEKSYSDKTVEKTFMTLSKKRFAARVQPSIQVPTMCGNMYCGSVYGSLCALLSNVSSQDLQGKRVGIFSYGSGLASSFFSFRVKGSTEEMHKQIDLQNRLDSRRVVAPEVYDEMCNLRERAHLKKDYSPAGNPETLFPGTYYLTKVDDLFRREYAIKQ
ncbi:unnamed protein product [Aureobasidium vineae]|uniref:Hydroxymethylglutaryl-CoA synthase n=1 Tax=Aureobasidium vineae TaxID=2773715 RepID=A0A9N8PHH2_9PEZI|nr:unnamed protein product [Aureobasidium vineae]